MNWMPHASDTKIVWNALEWITVKPVWVNSINTEWESPRTVKPCAEMMKEPANVLSVNATLCLLGNTLPPHLSTLMTTTCSTPRLDGTQKRNVSPAVDQLIQNAAEHQLDHISFSTETTQTRNAAQMEQLRLIAMEVTTPTTTVADLETTTIITITTTAVIKQPKFYLTQTFWLIYMSHEIESFWTIVSVNINPRTKSHDQCVGERLSRPTKPPYPRPSPQGPGRLGDLIFNLSD